MFLVNAHAYKNIKQRERSGIYFDCPPMMVTPGAGFGTKTFVVEVLCHRSPNFYLIRV